MANRLTKWQVVDGVIVKHMSYGLRVRVPTGEVGVVDRSDIADLPLKESEWPSVGQPITVVCAGYTSGTLHRPPQLRLSAKSSIIDLARTK